MYQNEIGIIMKNVMLDTKLNSINYTKPTIENKIYSHMHDCAGLDTLIVEINPHYVDDTLWRNLTDPYNIYIPGLPWITRLAPQNKEDGDLTIHYYMIIQRAGLSIQSIEDAMKTTIPISVQTIYAASAFYKCGAIKFPCDKGSMTEVEFYYYCTSNFNKIFDYKRIDIFLDFKEGDLDFSPTYMNTAYSSAYMNIKDSQIVAYDKRKKASDKPQLLSYDAASSFPLHLEFRLTRENCEYLNISYFQLGFYQFFHTFIVYLSNQYIRECKKTNNFCIHRTNYNFYANNLLNQIDTGIHQHNLIKREKNLIERWNLRAHPINKTR